MDSPNPPSPAGVLGPALSVKLYRVRTVLKRHWWILLLTVAADLAFEGWRVYKEPERFTSSSEIMVRDEVVVNEANKISESYAVLFGNTIKLLESDQVKLGAQRIVELEAPQLSGTVSIAAQNTPRTSIFTVSGIGTNPEYTRRFVDAVIDEFMQQYRNIRQGTLRDTNEEIEAQLASIQESIGREKTELEAFVKANGMQAWEKQVQGAEDYLAELRNRQAELNTEMHRLEHLSPEQLLVQSPKTAPAADSARAAGPSDSVFSGELVQQYLESNRDLAALQAHIGERSKVWKPKHPKLIDLKDRAQQLQGTIDWIQTQAGEMMTARIASIKSALQSLETQIADWELKVRDVTEKNAKIVSLEANMKRYQDQEDKLMAARLRIGQPSGDIGVLKRLNRANAARPVSKGAVKHMLLGLIGGLLAGSLILFVLDRSDDRLSSSTEIIEHFSEPILGQVPNVSDSRIETGLPLLQADDERYTYAESFRSLRSSLIFMPDQADLKTLLVTSAIPNEGKSTLASNLAITMAAAGARVLLIDADLRRGDIAALFDIAGRDGLSNILRGETMWPAVVEATRYPNLFVIPRGPVTNQSAELLLKPVLETMLDEMKVDYDLVVINSAPILATDDTPTMAPHIDGVLMVMRAGFTGARLTQNALQALYARQVNVLGLIMNCVDTEMPDYYYYRYPKYYAAG